MYIYIYISILMYGHMLAIIIVHSMCFVGNANQQVKLKDREVLNTAQIVKGEGKDFHQETCDFFS